MSDQIEVLSQTTDRAQSEISELTELARALRIAYPTLRDHEQSAVVIRNIMRSRGVELVRVQP